MLEGVSVSDLTIEERSAPEKRQDHEKDPEPVRRNGKDMVVLQPTEAPKDMLPVMVPIDFLPGYPS